MARHIERRRKLRPVYPAPELVIDESLDIQEESGLGGSMEIGDTGDRKRRMRVPLADTPRARHIRAHETAHAKFSPRVPMIPEKMPDIAMQRAEDMRMNYYCHQHGLTEAMGAPTCESDSGHIIDMLVVSPLQRGRILDAITAASATYKTGDWPLVLDAIRYVNPDLADQTSAFIPTLWDYLADKRDPSWDDAMRNAWELVKFAERPEGYPSDPDPSGDGKEGSSDEDAPGDPSSGDSEGDSEDSETDSDDSDGSGSDSSSESEDKPDEIGEPGSPGSPGTGESEEDKPTEPGDKPDTGDKPSDSEPGTKTGEPGTGDPSASDGAMREIDLSDPMDKLIDRASEADEKRAADASFEDDPVEGPVRQMLEFMEHFPSDVTIVEKMTVEKRPLKQRLAASKLKGRTRIAQDHGRVPRYMGRYCADKSIFEGPGKRKGGGAILIDCSGSMALRDEHIDRILTDAPAATIAVYNGSSAEGFLWIIAANGKRVATGDPLRPHHFGNVVDIPALRWLAKQRGDKYWICDGIVTGKGDRGGSNIAEICADICRRAHIMRVPTIPKFVELIESL